jgi:dTDP-4-amino-4,6-dideoxygalactose transaminase
VWCFLVTSPDIFTTSSLCAWMIAISSNISSNFEESKQKIYYPRPLHLQECFSYLGHRTGDFPAAEKAAEQSVALPIYPELSEIQEQYVVEEIGEFYFR